MGGFDNLHENAHGFINENSQGFRSTDFPGYKPYQKPGRDHSWRDDFELDELGDVIPGTCHACDYRRTSCISTSFPRYYCHKDDNDVERANSGPVQTTLI